MGGPVLVEVTRSGLVESRHRGSVVVVDTGGSVVLELGDADLAILPRSAVKAFQAVPLVASGAADAFGFDDRALALACASHSGEADHVAHVTATLTGFGAGVEDLACGAHWPSGAEAARALAAAGGAPTAAHNNCSGKHTGFLALAQQLGVPTAAYTDVDHPVQVEVRAAMEAICTAPLGPPAIDGCSAPTWPIPLRALATGFARFGTGDGLAPDHASAAVRLRSAVADHPWYVAGTGRFCTDVMAATGARAFVKVGAEGAYTAALPELGLGVALKVEDGAFRAAEVALATVLQRLLPDLDLDRFVRPPVTTWRGIVVGELRPAPDVASAPWADSRGRGN